MILDLSACNVVGVQLFGLEAEPLLCPTTRAIPTIILTTERVRMIANKNGGALSGYSAKLLNGTRHRFSGFNQARQ